MTRPHLVGLLFQLDDHPLWTTDKAQLRAVFKALYLAECFRAALFQPGNNSVDIFDGKCNVPDPQGIEGRLLNSPFIGRRRERDELDIGRAAGRPQHHPCRLDAVKPRHTICPRAFHVSFPDHFETEVDEERSGGGEIAYDDPHMIDALNLHIAYLLLMLW